MLPKYLYHYTSIDSLKAILDSRTIRFSRLDLVNDPYEGLCNISGTQNEEFAKSLFCSCWTASNEENIALWKIYTDCKGVRIKTDSMLLFGPIKGFADLSIGYVPVTPISPIAINAPELARTCQIKQVYGPLKVSYFLDEDLLGSLGVQVLVANHGKPTEHTRNFIKLFEIGSRKDAHWAYEEEWRFLASPFSAVSIPVGEKGASYRAPALKEYALIPFLGEIEEVVAGPEMAETDYERLERILHGRDIALRKSVVKTRFQKETQNKKTK